MQTQQSEIYLENHQIQNIKIEEISENESEIETEIPTIRSRHIKHKSAMQIEQPPHKHLFHNYDFNKDKFNFNHNYITSPNSPVIQKKSHYQYLQNIQVKKIKAENQNKIKFLDNINQEAKQTGIKPTLQVKQLPAITQQIFVFETGLTDQQIEKYITHLNQDMDAQYLACSFPKFFHQENNNKFLNNAINSSSNNNSNIISANKTNLSIMSQISSLSSPKKAKFIGQLPSLSTKARQSEVYSYNNLRFVSKLQVQNSLQSPQYNKAGIQINDSQSMFHLNSQMSFNSNMQNSDISKGNLSQRGNITTQKLQQQSQFEFGLRFPALNFEMLKRSFHYLEGSDVFKDPYRFWRIKIQTNHSVDSEVGFIELKLNTQKKTITFVKFYIFKIFRKMELLYKKIHFECFKQIFLKYPEYNVIQLRLIHSNDTYKQYLVQLGFTLINICKINEELFSMLIFKKSNLDYQIKIFEKEENISNMQKLNKAKTLKQF